MRLRWTALLVATGIVAMATPIQAWAQEQERPAGRRQSPSAQRRGRPQLTIEQVRGMLDLDEQQQAEFDRIATEFREQRTSNDANRMRELIAEARQARQAGDTERAAEIRKEIREVRRAHSMEGFLDKIDGILRPDQREKLAEIRKQFSPGRRPESGPLDRLSRLREELALTDQQAEQYDQLYAELEKQLEQYRQGDEETRALVEELIEAAEAGDEQRVRELRERLHDPRAQAEEAIAEFLDKVEPILKPEQVDTLQRFRQRTRGGRAGAELREYFRFVSRLELDEQQRRSLAELRRDASRQEREARRDPDKLAQVTQTVREKIRELLNDDQVAEFDRWLADRESQRPGHGRRGDRPRQRGARPGAERGGTDVP